MRFSDKGEANMRTMIFALGLVLAAGGAAMAQGGAHPCSPPRGSLVRLLPA